MEVLGASPPAQPPGATRAISAERRAGERIARLRYPESVRYLVRARVKTGRQTALLSAIENRTLGRGSVAEGEYLRNMREARVDSSAEVRWFEICYCPTPLQEERPYWEEYFDLVRVQDAHSRRNCRHENGCEPWACDSCDCTLRLERKLATRGEPFLEQLKGGRSLTLLPSR